MKEETAKLQKANEDISKRFPDLKVIPVPTPWAVGRINVFLIEGREPALVDTGVDTEWARKHLEHGLAHFGYKMSDIRKVLLTHSHLDHYGMARHISECAGGAEVFIGARDAIKVLRHTEEEMDLYNRVYEDYFRKLGIPENLIELNSDATKGFEFFAKQVDKVTSLQDGDILEVNAFKLKALNMPGHTVGMMNYLDEEKKIMFTGDHILLNITPNPLLELIPGEKQKERSLVNYLGSLERCRKLDVEMDMPGHGPLITEHLKTVNYIDTHHRRRSGAVLKILGSRDLTAYEVSRKLFPGLFEEMFFLCLSEGLGHLELLEDEGKVKRFERDGVFRFRAIGK
jgi:glyoxylase-like metal-dependent hydrolase (beta-lactamase superfamily II)